MKPEMQAAADYWCGRMRALCKRRRVLVVGDIMLDRWIQGAATRISPEAPVPVIRADWIISRLGGAGNVARNLAALGAEVSLFGVIGSEPNIVEELDQQLELEHRIRFSGIRVGRQANCSRTRVMDGQHQYLRVDWDRDSLDGDLKDEEFREFKAKLRSELDRAEIVVLSDYGQGVGFLAGAHIAHFLRMRRKPWLLDAKPKLVRHIIDFMPEVTLLKLNHIEACELARMDSKADTLDAMRSVFDWTKVPILFVTQGKEGSLIVDRLTRKIQGFKSMAETVLDVAGAGDASTAAAALALVNVGKVEEIAMLASEASALSVAGRFTGTISVDEMCDMVKERARKT